MTNPTIGILALGLACISVPAFAQNVAAGERVFKAQCAACHSTLKGKDMLGPSMWEVIGPNGPFESLEVFDRYLEDPKAILPKTIMKYPGLKNAQQRKDLLAYLATLK